jgi:hypothetical protein
MRVETQLSAFLENKAGALAALAADLGRHDVNIRGLTIANLTDHAVVRFVVSDARKALHLLGERGVLVVVSDILAVDMPDRPGALAVVTRQLARAGVNINYAYGSVPAVQGEAVVYLHVSDLKKARAALQRLPRRSPRRRRRR